jgi:hypothetical protein
MTNQPRSEQIASVFTRRQRGIRATLAGTPSTPTPTEISTPSLRACSGRETPNTPTPPSATPNLSALVRSANPGTELSGTDDAPQDPTSIIGTPATAAAFVDRVANMFSLLEDNRSGLHSFSKVYVCPPVLSLCPTPS